MPFTGTQTLGNNNFVVTGPGGGNIFNPNALLIGGIDSVSYINATSFVNVNLLSNTGTGVWALGDNYTGISDLTGTNFADVLTGNNNANTIFGANGSDIISGLGGNDRLYGDGGNDTLNGGDGDDLLVGGAGADTINGGIGSDTVSYAGAGPVFVNLGIQTAQASTYTNALGVPNVSNLNAAGDIISADVENLTGSSGNDILWGNSGSNIINGGSGNDVIRGGAGNDTLFGSLGTDTLDISYITGTSGSTQTVQWGMGVTINTSTSSSSRTITDLTSNTFNLYNSNGTIAETDSLNSFENVTGGTSNDLIRGNSGNNVLTGGSGWDVIFGLDGDDIISNSGTLIGSRLLSGGNGNDNITGSGGTDTIVGGNGNDTLNGGDGSDWIEGDSGIYNTATGLASDTGNDTLNGNGGDDYLYGGKGNDISNGGDGNDFIWDFAGINTISGNAGSDTHYFSLVYDDINNNTFTFQNTITDFVQGQDIIKVQGMGLNSGTVTLSYQGSDTIVQFDANHQFIVQNVFLNAADLWFA